MVLIQLGDLPVKVRICNNERSLDFLDFSDNASTNSTIDDCRSITSFKLSCKNDCWLVNTDCWVLTTCKSVRSADFWVMSVVCSSVKVCRLHRIWVRRGSGELGLRTYLYLAEVGRYHHHHYLNLVKLPLTLKETWFALHNNNSLKQQS